MARRVVYRTPAGHAHCALAYIYRSLSRLSIQPRQPRQPLQPLHNSDREGHLSASSLRLPRRLRLRHSACLCCLRAPAWRL